MANRSSNNTLVKRQRLPLQTTQYQEEIPEYLVQALTTIPSQAQVVAPVSPQAGWSTSRKIDANERDIWLYFETESNQGWHPDSRNGIAAIKNMADCLVEPAQARYANLNVAYFQAELATKYYRSTIREEVALCRSLCVDTLAGITSDMQQLSNKSGKLWGLEGPIMRALRHWTSPTDNIVAASEHMKDVEVTHVEILSILIAISGRWDRFNSQVNDLVGALSAQLALSPQGRASIQQFRDKAKARLSKYTQEIEDITRRMVRTHIKIEGINKDGSTTKAEIAGLALKMKTLNAKVKTLEQEYDQVEEELKEKPVAFEAARTLEDERQKRVRRNTAPVGWVAWAYSTVYGDTSGEAARLKAWKNKEEEYETWYASIICKRLELSDQISCAKHERANAALKQQQWSSGDEIQQKMEELESQRRNAQKDLVGAKPRLNELNEEIKRLTASLNRQDTQLEALVDYAKIVPGLCGNLRELAANVDLSRREYEQVLERYQSCSSQLEHISRRMAAQNASPEDVHILCDDVIRLRIVYLVMAAASAWSSAMSKSLYEEALRHLAPLGTVPESAIPGRLIRLDDTRKAHDDIYKLTQLAEEKGSSMSHARYQGVESLRPHVQDIISSVKNVRPPKSSKWSFSRKSKKSISGPPPASGSYWPDGNGVGELP